ncbi:hypothetical protein T4D_2965, partial [Trichinella pseudospiralis]
LSNKAAPASHLIADTVCDQPFYINASFTFAGAKTFREMCFYTFVPFCSRWLVKTFSNSARSVLIHCAEDVVIYGRVGKSFADVKLRINLLKTHLGFVTAFWHCEFETFIKTMGVSKLLSGTNGSPVKHLNRLLIFSTKLLFKYTRHVEQVDPYNSSHGINKYEQQVILLTFTMMASKNMAK